MIDFINDVKVNRFIHTPMVVVGEVARDRGLLFVIFFIVIRSFKLDPSIALGRPPHLFVRNVVIPRSGPLLELTGYRCRMLWFKSSFVADV